MGSSANSVDIILDTNFLLVPGLYGVDIFDELSVILNRNYKAIILTSVIDELKHLAAEGNLKERSAARLALKMVSEGEIVDVTGPTDEEILKLARKSRSAVGTNDTKLRDKLRAEKIPVIYLRQKSHLAINGYLQ